MFLFVKVITDVSDVKEFAGLTVTVSVSSIAPPSPKSPSARERKR